MKGELKKNICHLGDHVVLSKVKDISTCKKVYIGDALEYACCFWANQLMKIASNSPNIKKVQEAADEFFTTHLLYWIKVLSLTQNLDTGVCSLNDI